MSLRPTKLEDIVGQDNIKQRLNISIAAAKGRGEMLPHILADGPPGTGKTTVAQAIANEMGQELIIANGANLRSIKSLLPYLARAGNNILFIDEIHRCTTLVQEFLYPAMEDFRFDIGGDGEMSIDLEPFTLIGATTEAGALAPPLYDRFTLKYHLSLYNTDELSYLIKLAGAKMGLTVTSASADYLAKTSRGTPRIALARLKWVGDYVFPKEEVSVGAVADALKLAEIHPDGTTPQDRQYLDVLKEYAGTPIGLKTLVAETGLAPETITEQIEPYLLRKDLIKRTSKGRVLA